MFTYSRKPQINDFHVVISHSTVTSWSVWCMFTCSELSSLIRPFVLCLPRSRSRTRILGPVHTYPDIFESAYFCCGLKKKFTSARTVFESNSPVHMYPAGIRIHCSAQYSSVNIVNRACAKQRVLRNVRIWRQISLFCHKIERFRITPTFMLMSWGNMLILCAVDH